MTARRAPTLVTAPTVEPVTVDEVKLLARIDGTDEDALLADFITAARTAAEQYTRRSFITQTHKLTLDLGCSRLYNSLPEGVHDLPASAVDGELPKQIRLPKGPLQSVGSVVTYDTADASTTYDASNYLVDTASDRITLTQNAVWPSPLRPYASCAITYIAGYGATAVSVPMPIRMAIRMHAATLYETRGQCGCDEPPDAAKSMLGKYRIMDGF